MLESHSNYVEEVQWRAETQEVTLTSVSLTVALQVNMTETTASDEDDDDTFKLRASGCHRVCWREGAAWICLSAASVFPHIAPRASQ